MKDFNAKRERRTNKARERRAKRRERHATMASLGVDSVSKLGELKNKGIPEPIQRIIRIILNIIQDGWWYLRQKKHFWKYLAGGIGVVVLIFFLSLVFSPNIGPNIHTMGISIGGKSLEDASATLAKAFDEMRITLRLEGESFSSATPADLGISLDTETTVQLAKEAGLSGLPFGHEIEPVFEVDYSTAQTYMLGLINEVYIPSYEAGYEWRDGALFPVAGSPSLELNVVLTVQRIVDDTIRIVDEEQLDLVTSSTEPNVMDSTPYLEEAQVFINSGVTIIGYDPFTDEEQQWQTSKEEMARWIIAGPNGLAVRESGFERFANGVNNLLNSEEIPRYLNEDTVREALIEAIDAGQSTVYARINYLPRVHTIESGETGFSVGRTTGLPFRLISDANPSVDWNSLVIGQEIIIPSRDAVIPIDPNPESGKRIIVDLDRLYLVAYQDEEIVFSWAVSSGMSQAPTSPGIYQILEKVDVAFGSSFSLCGNNGCGQWQMDYFMGIYEVAPGLTNGFHGAVLLPNGAYLDGGSAQVRSTFGCVMSDNEQARQLYEWADLGTMVEIVSREFPPESETARMAIEYIEREYAL